MDTKIWTREEISNKIATDQKWLERAIVALWHKQTSDEQATRETKHLNGVGFSAAHAKHLTRAANWINGGHHLDGTYLTRAREMAAHYVGQLVEIANENEAHKQQAAPERDLNREWVEMKNEAAYNERLQEERAFRSGM